MLNKYEQFSKQTNLVLQIDYLEIIQFVQIKTLQTTDPTNL